MNLSRRLPASLRIDAAIIAYALISAWLVFSGI